uniref:Threonylcarbamoyl-AMP synthase n=1 Tax=Branchiostoma floridae TaxID=7739 RepID=C3ZNQ7_BRAFL|eukprot:XP_002589778.1 hypothetical protein BRAFLDRAFT_90451 [Branchiostoma floridae]
MRKLKCLHNGSTLHHINPHISPLAQIWRQGADENTLSIVQANYFLCGSRFRGYIPAKLDQQKRMSTVFLPTRILLRSCTGISRKMAKIIKLDDDMLEKQLSMAAKSLQAGNIIAVPTDTIYGLAGLAQSTEAVEQIYAIKGRNSSKPVAISVAEVSDIPR